MEFVTLYPESASDDRCNAVSMCGFCRQRLSRLDSKEQTWGSELGTTGSRSSQLVACQSCGWWFVVCRSEDHGYAPQGWALPWSPSVAGRRTWGVLKRFSYCDRTETVTNLVSALTLDYRGRYKFHPQRFQDIVAHVFAASGYDVLFASRGSRDDGVDLVVANASTGEQLAVQVKRLRGAVEAQQIREFTGALVLGGMRAGVFVTTSMFSRGARTTARRAAERGHLIQLWDGDSLFERLRLTMRPKYDIPDNPSAPFFTTWQSAKAWVEKD